MLYFWSDPQRYRAREAPLSEMLDSHMGQPYDTKYVKRLSEVPGERLKSGGNWSRVNLGKNQLAVGEIANFLKIASES